MPLVAIALGSNLGDRRAHVHAAVEALQPHLRDLRTSSLRETEPEGVPDAQPPYVNAVVVGNTTLAPEALLAVLFDIEHKQGRERRGFRSARTLDLDLILYGDAVIDTPTLTLPHPRFRERRFVVEPLAEVAPDFTDPVTGLTSRELLEKLV
jgi:2-amino-4-hydroxy-6-hydroxymethyldihydropteridine diphosphokinase